MDDIDWMDVKEKDDTIRELRQKLAEANKRITELEAESENWRVSFHEAIIQLQAALEDIEKKDKELSDET